jgi:hypothetical protein
MVNRSLVHGSCIHGRNAHAEIRLLLLSYGTCCCAESSVDSDSGFAFGNPFDCAGCHVVWFSRGSQRMFAMIEMVTAFMGLIGAGIFLAHAFEGVLFRA